MGVALSLGVQLLHELHTISQGHEKLSTGTVLTELTRMVGAPTSGSRHGRSFVDLSDPDGNTIRCGALAAVGRSPRVLGSRPDFGRCPVGESRGDDHA